MNPMGINAMRSRIVVGLLGAALGMGCASVRPATAPRVPVGAPAEPPAPPLPAAAPELPTTPPAPVVSVPVLPSPPPQESPLPAGPAPPRLVWVNPARCLPACALDPAANLVRVNDRAERDERGRHRIAQEIESPLRGLLDAAKAAGHNLRIESAFRSYEEQARLFAATKEQGRAARPGHSEHQLGSTVDLRLPTGAAIAWLSAHAADFAFALSYPPYKQRLTGYRSEPWHIRYVGPKLAQLLRQSGSTLEELFRAQPALAESGTCMDCPLPASRAACGDVTATGSCAGTVLMYCYDGALASIDCAVSGQRCGLSTAGVFDCLEKQPLSDAAK